MTATHRHWKALALVAMAGALMPAACTSEPEPLPTTATSWPAEPDGTPAVVWPHGEPDDGKWAENPWVRAVRVFDRAYASAFYLNDFTLTRFHGTGIDYDIDRTAADRSDVVRSAWTTGARDGTRVVLDTPDPLEYYPGPKPFYVLDVDTYESASGQEQATVYGCGIEGWVVADPQDVPHDPTQQDPKIWEYRLRRVNNTQIQVDPNGSASRHDGKAATQLCDTSRVRLGFFDPAPPYVRPVLPWEVLDSNSQPIEDFDPEIAAHATPRPAPPPVPTGDDG
ncbi:hypothetical protein [Cellulomonas hominis]